MQKAKTQIIFLKVATPQAKQNKLCEIVHFHFEKGDRILISVPSIEVARYVDELLWRLPEESFLPHVIVESSIDESVVITIKSENLNHATIVFNLQGLDSSLAGEVDTIYELLDETHPEKLKASKGRLESYQKRGYVPLEKE